MPSRKAEARSPKSSPAAGSGGRDLALGIDLGATKVISALVDPEGGIVHQSARYPHSNDGAARVLEVVLQSARECLANVSVLPRTVGIAVAAQVDPRSGVVVYSPNLGWREEPVAAPLTRALGIPVRVVNDARAATFAEWTFGAGRGESELFCLVLGTGVGGSAVLGGVLVEGSSYSAGEVGHLTLVSGGRPCHCPNWGCFEAYVGGWAIADRARDGARASSTEAATLVRLAGSLDAITAETVFEAERGGDPLAARIVGETERYLADGAVSVVNAFNPSVLVLAGGLIAGRPEWVEIVASDVLSRCQPAAAGVRVLAAELGESAGVVGAAALGRVAPPASANSRARSRG